MTERKECEKVSFQEEKNTWIDRHANIYRNLKERKRSLKNFLLFPRQTAMVFLKGHLFMLLPSDCQSGDCPGNVTGTAFVFLGMVTMISFYGHLSSGDRAFKLAV